MAAGLAALLCLHLLLGGRVAASEPPATPPDHPPIKDAQRQWWAFQPLNHPSLERSKAIDALVGTHLASRGLSIQPKADRRTLIRRASFDLLGLPPDPAEVDAFNRDPSQDAWDRVVERMLARPQYGERWARHWLDVARFAESSGFEHDYDRPNAYHYRDFVIKALNSDMPYDQFVRWQIAGDEYEPDNPLALMATGFLGAGVFPTQITANEVERTRYDAMDDMLSTTASAMLALTVGCARCHDHKFDPIPTADYYRMLATFTSTVRSDVELDLMPEENQRAKEEFDRAHRPLADALKSYEEQELPTRFQSWLDSGASPSAPAAWELIEPRSITSKAGASFKRLDDGSYLVEGNNADFDSYTMTSETGGAGLRAVRIEALPHESMPKKGPGRADNGNIGLSRIRVFASPATGGATGEVRLASARATFQQNSNNLSVASALDDNPKTGWAVDPKFGTHHSAVFEFAEPVGFAGGTRLEVRLEFDLNTRHNIGRPRFAVSRSLQPPLMDEATPPQVAATLHRLRSSPGAAASLSVTEREALLQWWKSSDPGWRDRWTRVEEHARQAPKPKLTKVLICAEGYPPARMHTQGADFFPETHFLNRGSTDLKKGVASPGFLQVLLRDPELEQRWAWQPPGKAKHSGRRRGLANWMTDPLDGSGKLLARVIVNRLWQHHLGQGIVSTPNDFGVQGTKPAQPELLDWLAAELIRGGWRLKPIHQLIMGSRTYQQSTAVVTAAADADPTVAAFIRRPQRLSAEAVRDSLLHVCGVLDTHMFGPGTLSESSRRRSIYFTVKRSQLIPPMQAFDAPEPLVSQGTRPTTTVAPQALMLMNSPHVREWAAALARRCSPAEGSRPDPARIVGTAYSLALNRAPTPDEETESAAFIEQQTARHQADNRSDATELALTDFAQVVLSLNEFIYVD